MSSVQNLKPVNQNLDSVTLQDIENHKLISDVELKHDLSKLKEFDASNNSNSFVGNPFLYHFQFKNLLKCERETGPTFYEIWNDPDKKQKLIDQTRLRNRGGKTAAGNIFECYRINLGSIVMFKATTAKYIYQKYNAKSVLDPTAGWGGRMLGAWALDIDYTGIDTNINLKPAYDDMIEFMNGYSNDFHNILFEHKISNLSMIYDSCLNVDFSQIEYDFVLTSPPYVNLEIYEHMTPWDSKESFYKDFFLPLWDKCKNNIKENGKIAFNISPAMYDDAIKYGLTPCDMSEDLLQQLGQQKNKKKQDKIYIWNC